MPGLTDKMNLNPRVLQLKPKHQEDTGQGGHPSECYEIHLFVLCKAP